MRPKHMFLPAACLLTTIGAIAPASAQIWASHWNETANGNDLALDLVTDHAGNVIVTGYADRGLATGSDFTTIKLNSTTGRVLWVRHYNGTGNGFDYPNHIVVDSHDNVIVTGWSYGGAATGYDYATIKYDGTTGKSLWIKRYNGAGSGDDYAQALAVDSQDNVIVTGSAWGGASRGGDIKTVKYSADTGDVLWVKTYNGLGSGPDQGAAIRVDRSDNVFVTGSSDSGAGIGSVFITIKYNGATGAALWMGHYGEGGDSSGYGSDLAIDHDGNVIVTGSVYHGSTTGSDFTTIKYDSPTGKILWVRHYDDPEHNSDNAGVVRVDSRNNIVVTGFAINSAGHHDLATVKYDSAGTVLWTRFDNSAPNGFRDAVGMTLDNDDNVVIACSGDSLAGDADYITLKYNGATGTTLWSHTYDGPAHGRELATAVGVDSQNNVFVTGGSYGGTATDEDYLTIKYAP